MSTSTITIIAGPPGIGKTSSSETIIKGNLYLNQDYFYLQYKAHNNADPDKAGSDKFMNEIFSALDSRMDFSYETNLGYQRQYDDLKRVMNYNPNNLVNLHLYFTQDIQLCWDRAERRFAAGGHYVSDKTIYQMYNNTFPLLKSNIDLFTRISLYDVKEYRKPQLILEVDKAGNIFKTNEELPKWLTKNILSFLEERLKR